MRPIIGCALLFAALSSAACHTMKPVSLEQLNVLKPDRVWVTDADQSVVVVSGPHIVGDTLVGYINGKYEEQPSAGLKQVIVRTPAPKRTALLAVGIAATLGVFFLAISEHGNASVNNAACYQHPDTPSCT